MVVHAREHKSLEGGKLRKRGLTKLVDDLYTTVDVLTELKVFECRGRAGYCFDEGWEGYVTVEGNVVEDEGLEMVWGANELEEDGLGYVEKGLNPELQFEMGDATGGPVLCFWVEGRGGCVYLNPCFEFDEPWHLDHAPVEIPWADFHGAM